MNIPLHLRLTSKEITKRIKRLEKWYEFSFDNRRCCLPQSFSCFNKSNKKATKLRIHDFNNKSLLCSIVMPRVIRLLRLGGGGSGGGSGGGGDARGLLSNYFQLDGISPSLCVCVLLCLRNKDFWCWGGKTWKEEDFQVGSSLFAICNWRKDRARTGGGSVFCCLTIEILSTAPARCTNWTNWRLERIFFLLHREYSSVFILATLLLLYNWTKGERAELKTEKKCLVYPFPFSFFYIRLFVHACGGGARSMTRRCFQEKMEDCLSELDTLRHSSFAFPLAKITHTHTLDSILFL